MTVLTPVARETVWGTNIVVEVSSAAPTADPVWVDISAWVMVPGGATLETWIGRATELETSEPGRFSLVLNNRDSRFTPGNTSSPYYPWFKQARRLRIREVVAWRAFDLMDGFIEIPDNLIFTEVVGEADSDITLAVSGLDRVGREANGRPFISTLAAHILGTPTAATLLHYWPMGDATDTARPAVGSLILRPFNFFVDPLEGVSNADLLQAAGGEPMPGDDLAPMHFGPRGHYTGSFAAIDGWRQLVGTFDPILTVTTGDVVTVAAWLRTQDVEDASPDWLPGTTWKLHSTPSLGAPVYSLNHFDSLSNSPTAPSGFKGHEFEVVATHGAAGWSTFADGIDYTGGSPTLLTVQTDATTGNVTWWINGREITATPSAGTPAASYTFDQIGVALLTGGDICHLQIYIGDAGTFTRADHLAQFEVGIHGLERQSTGARINTIADYIGIPAAARDVDEGVVLMSAASLAGRTAADAWREAADTEQGRLTTDAGRLVFHDRRHVYDI